MPGESRDESRARGRALLLSKLAAATLVAILALAVGVGGCAPEENTGGSDPTSMSSGSVEAQHYTCAMHPHINLPEPGNCPICGMELIPVTTGSTQVSGNALKLSPYAAALARVQTARVERRPVTIELRLAGKLAFDETRVRTISAWLPGRIDRLYVDYVGVTVKVGDHLGEFYGPDLLASQQ
ncbi:MAG: efflux RND transporter periplasmic adaptor subunit, partial [Myxococcales bacterium]|nr:efflux RND transporter periplasmic adaptor subunit [Myxococcales bacterium]